MSIVRGLFKYIVRLADHWYSITRHSKVSASIGFKWDDEDHYSLIFETPKSVVNYQLSRDQAVALATWILESVRVEREKNKVHRVPPTPPSVRLRRGQEDTSVGHKRNVIKFDRKFKPLLLRNKLDGKGDD
jgi:hypothetical protein